MEKVEHTCNPWKLNLLDFFLLLKREHGTKQSTLQSKDQARQGGNKEINNIPKMQKSIHRVSFLFLSDRSSGPGAWSGAAQ